MIKPGCGIGVNEAAKKYLYGERGERQRLNGGLGRSSLARRHDH